MAEIIEWNESDTKDSVSILLRPASTQFTATHQGLTLTPKQRIMICDYIEQVVQSARLQCKIEDLEVDLQIPEHR